MAPDSDLLSRLVISKRIIQEAEQYLRLNAGYHRMMSVILLDSVNDNIIRLVLSKKFGSHPKEGELFPNLVKLLKNECEANACPVRSDLSAMSRLHLVRNNAQHKGIIPDVIECQTALSATKDFFNESIEKLGLTFQQIRMAALIKNDAVRENIVLAEKYFEEGNYKMCIAYCKFGFHIAHMEEGLKINPDLDLNSKKIGYYLPGKDFGLFPLYSSSGIIVNSVAWPQQIYTIPTTYRSGDEESIKEILAEIRGRYNELVGFIQNELAVLRLPIDYRKYKRFQTISYPINYTIKEEQNKRMINELKFENAEYSPEDAWFCLNFVLDTILVWES